MHYHYKSLFARQTTRFLKQYAPTFEEFGIPIRNLDNFKLF
ncbi:hypothetical protein BDD43_2452 [Mucilaginibacter gracilis]|uniref:Uncharacterized protein n=1 Tax=Mucilaginibacter gracilis TaxID=423350 RepID=A0A495IZY1_9SPHI|nr:hypothetical protein BDD43_2452 [Mucilaginibacter gracilis]